MEMPHTVAEVGRIALHVASHRFAGGPLLFPGSPFTFAGSCSCTERFCEAEPTVPCCEGPFLPPGAPLIPAPEFWALGAVETAPDVSALLASPGIREAEPGLSCSPTYPDAPEFCVLMPLSASFWSLWRRLLGNGWSRHTGDRHECCEC